MYVANLSDRVGQGDIFKDLSYEYVTVAGDTSSVPFPFWVVMSQDCDLLHDFNSTAGIYEDDDKRLQTVLVCPAFLSNQLRSGLHMSSLDWTMKSWGSTLWSQIRGNNNARFHMLSEDIEKGIPELVLDFKRFYTFPREYLYKNLDKRVTRLDDLFKEAASTRFSYYLSRIALPDLSSE